MKYGVVYPQNELPADPETLKTFAQAVEDSGFDHLLTYEHVLGANPDRPGGWTGPYTHQDAFWDPVHHVQLSGRLWDSTGICDRDIDPTAAADGISGQTGSLPGCVVSRQISDGNRVWDGTRWSMSPRGRISITGVCGWRNRWMCFANCGQNPWSRIQEDGIRSQTQD